MNASFTMAGHTSLRPDRTVVSDSDLSATGCGGGGGWVWGYVTRIGHRHLARGGVCEDAAGIEVCDDSVRSGIHVALADGVSGGARGDVAANALVSHCLAWRPDAGASLGQWIGRAADEVVRNALNKHTANPGAATVAAAWLNADGSGIATRVGDCRVYLLQPGTHGSAIDAQLVLHDQTMASMGYDTDDSVCARQPAHMVGNSNTGIPELLPISVGQRSGLLLSSDGLHGVIGAEELTAALAPLFELNVAIYDPAHIRDRCISLVALAQQRGGDDVSVLIALRAPASCG